MKLLFNGLDVLEDIGVIVFQIIKNHGARSVVDKLTALIAKTRVVLIALDYKGLSRPELRRVTEIGRNAAD